MSKPANSHLLRFAHFTGLAGTAPLPAAAASAAAVKPVMRRPLTRSEMAREAAAHPGYASADDVASAVLAAQKKLGTR